MRLSFWKCQSERTTAVTPDHCICICSKMLEEHSRKEQLSSGIQSLFQQGYAKLPNPNSSPIACALVGQHSDLAAWDSPGCAIAQFETSNTLYQKRPHICGEGSDVLSLQSSHLPTVVTGRELAHSLLPFRIVR